MTGLPVRLTYAAGMDQHLVVVVGYEGAELLDIACVTSCLDLANRLGAAPRYQVMVATPGGRTVTCSSGLRLPGQASLERIRGKIGTLVVSGGSGHDVAAGNAPLVGHVRRLARDSVRVSSLCTGASVLAAAGLLDGRRATTHWLYARELADRYPKVTVDPAPIFIRDGNVSTSAGISSALDLTLAFVEEDHGVRVARDVARALVTYLQRPGNQAQLSVYTAPAAVQHDAVRRAVDHVTDDLAGDLSVGTLARRVGVSERHLTRLFVEHVKQTPSEFVRTVRLEAAAVLLSESTLTVDRVARRCGYGSAETLRQAFVAQFGLSPSQHRAAHNRRGR